MLTFETEAHGIAMVPHTLMMPEYHIKFLTGIPWVVLPAIAIAFLRPSSSQPAGVIATNG